MRHKTWRKQNITQDMIQRCKSNTRNQKPDTRTNKNKSPDNHNDMKYGQFGLAAWI